MGDGEQLRVTESRGQSIEHPLPASTFTSHRANEKLSSLSWFVYQSSPRWLVEGQQEGGMGPVEISESYTVRVSLGSCSRNCSAGKTPLAESYVLFTKPWIMKCVIPSYKQLFLQKMTPIHIQYKKLQCVSTKTQAIKLCMTISEICSVILIYNLVHLFVVSSNFARVQQQ